MRENLLLKQKLWGLPLSTLHNVRRRGQRREPAQGSTPQPSTVWDLLQWQGKKPQASAGSFSELLVGCLRMLPIYSFYCQAGSVKLLKWTTASLFSDTNPEKALSPRKGFSAFMFCFILQMHSSCTFQMNSWEKPATTATGLQNAADLYPISHNNFFPSKHLRTLAFFSCSVSCGHMLSSVCFMETTLKSVKELQFSF